MAYFNNRLYNLNISKCNYDRTGHFKEYLKQYQGKQNTFVSPNVYKDLEDTLVSNGFICTDNSVDKKMRYKNVTKSHIYYFLLKLSDIVSITKITFLFITT